MKKCAVSRVVISVVISGGSTMGACCSFSYSACCSCSFSHSYSACNELWGSLISAFSSKL